MSWNPHAAAEELFAAGELEKALLAFGRNEAPHWLADKFSEGFISVEQLRTVLLGVWQMVEFPCRALDRRIWLEWFRATGFLSDADRVRPAEALHVWRSQVGRTLGLSWTQDRELAQWFHERNQRFGRESRLLCRQLQPEGVLALIEAGREGETEVVAHPRFLRACSGGHDVS